MAVVAAGVADGVVYTVVGQPEAGFAGVVRFDVDGHDGGLGVTLGFLVHSPRAMASAHALGRKT